MRDLDDLLDADISRAAADAATPPSLSDVVRRGERRRRTRHAVVSLAALVALAAVATVPALLEADRAADPTTPVSPRVTDGPRPEDKEKRELTAAEIVDDPRALVQTLTVSAHDPDVRAAVWRLCLDKRCTRNEAALSVTADGFLTRHVLKLKPELFVTPLDGRIALGNYVPSQIVQSDGTLLNVSWGSEPRPLVAGEVLLGQRGAAQHWYAVDPRTGRAHRLPTPANVNQLTLTSAGDLRGLRNGEGGTRRFVFSDDGGRTWTDRPVPGVDGLLTELVTSVQVDAVVGGGDGATLFPFEQVLRSRDVGASWQRFDGPKNPMAYLGRTGVMPDGRLLVEIETWSDGRGWRRPGSKPTGLWISDGDDWSALTPVEHTETFSLVGMTATADALTLYAWVPTSSDVWTSTDGGEHWEEFRAR